MTTHAKATIIVALAAGAGQVALARTLGPVWFGGETPPMYLLFLAGPPAFLALVAWRRHTHPARSRLLFRLALGLAAVGLGVIGYEYVRLRTDERPKPGGHTYPLIVPLAQWLAVLAVWVVLVVKEGREKRAAAT